MKYQQDIGEWNEDLVNGREKSINISLPEHIRAPVNQELISRKNEPTGQKPNYKIDK